MGTLGCALTNRSEDTVKYRIGDGAETASLTTIAQAAIDSNGGNGIAVNVLISTDNETWVEYIAPAVATKLGITDISITVL